MYAMENETPQERPRPVRFQLLGTTDKQAHIFPTAIADDLENQAQGILPYGIPGAPVDNQDRADAFRRIIERQPHRTLSEEAQITSMKK